MPRLAAALVLAASTLAGARGLALAQAPDAIFDPLTMDHHTPVSTLDVDFAFVQYDEPPNVDVTVMGLALSGQYVTPRGLGGYLSLPLSYVSVDNVLGLNDSELALGNLAIGGLYSKRLSPTAALVLHGGVALPTAADEGVAAFQALASSPRWGDFVQRLPNTSWLRLGVSPMGRSGILFWRADVGLDLALDEDEDNPIDYSPVFRINVGGGLDLRTAHLLVELVTNITDDGSEDETSSTLALGARFLSGNVRPGIGIILPVDFNSQIFDPDFAFTLSLAARL